MVFGIMNIERVWTKRDAFILMGCDDTEYSVSGQRLASFSLWKKSKFTMDFINEFLFFAQDERINYKLKINSDI